MFALLAFATAHRPVVLLPGLYGSNLVATHGKDYQKHWYCPKTQDHDLYWVNLKYVIPPTYNCLFEMLAGYYDEEKDKVTSPPGLSVDVPDFGGEGGLAYVDKNGILGWHFIESFAPMLDYFKGKGFTLKKDLWGCPYDWRLAMSGLEEDFFPKLQNLIETAYTTGGNMKVAVLGYSCGGMCLQRFFAQQSQEWKDKYIAKAIFLAPAFAGSPMTIDVAWNRYFPILKFLKTDSVRETVETVPCIHSLFPNHIVFGDLPLIKTKDRVITAKTLADFLVEQGKISEKNLKLFRRNIEITAQYPKSPGVPTMMLYNSKVDTALTMRFDGDLDDDYEVENTGGDGTVPAIGPQWACANWNATEYAFRCFDVADSSEDFDHVGMSTNAYVHDIIFQYFEGDDWVNERGSAIVTAPRVRMEANGTRYEVLPSVRGQSVQWLQPPVPKK